jgi:DNA topoisomerase-6 subunit B
VSTTRPPSVYRGNPFVVEVGLAYGGDLPADEPAEIMRFANRVPLQYQPKACAISESIYETNWRNYELQQPKGSLPIAPIAIAVHIASVWVPFTSEAKEAVAHYDELLEEMKLAVKECGRKLAAHLRAKAHAEREMKRRGLFEKYIPEVAAAISAILSVPQEKVEKPFFRALPRFVRFAETGNGSDGNETPEAPASPASPAAKTQKPAASPKPAAPAKPPPRPPKAAKGGRGEQMKLLE